MEEVTSQRIEEVNGNSKLDANPFKKGCNPHYSTARSKLQKKRSKINDDIIKELRLRKGAENLLRAATNKEVREKVTIELGFVNSKLEVLRNDLAQLNSSVKTYQNHSSQNINPMISLGLKETKDVSFKVVFTDYIEEHYSESGERYEEGIRELHTLRKAIRTPDRSDAGIELLEAYVQQLGFIEKRFYPPGSVVPIYFPWYDSLTGALTTQKTIGYEKGSVLFNIGALHSQIGTAQDRRTTEGLTKTVSFYQKSAGIFKYLRDRFAHAPSLDMNTETLTLLCQLMLSQGQECIYEAKVLSRGEPRTFSDHVTYAQEAAMVAQMYDETHNAVASKTIRSDVPSSWLTLTIVKSNHYQSLAHFYLASALLLQKEMLPSFEEIHQTLDKVTNSRANANKNHQYSDIKKRQDQYCRAHLKLAITLNETAQKDYNFCRSLRNNDDFTYNVLTAMETRMATLLIDVSDDTTDFEDIFLSVADIIPSVQTLVQVDMLNYNQTKTTCDEVDFFRELGPLSVFSALTEWTAPRTAQLHKSEMGYGFTIKGEEPANIIEVIPNNPAELAGLKVGDVLVKVNETDVKWLPQKDVKSLINARGSSVELTVVTPMPSSKPESLHTSDTSYTIRSSASSGSSNADMKQMDQSSTGTWRKMKNLTFLKNKKQTTPKGSLRKK